MISFNISVSDHKLPENIPYQIMPTTRGYLTLDAVMKYAEINNEDIVIHVNYIMRPFSDNAVVTRSKCFEQLSLYAILANRLNCRHILIHLPSSLSEFNNYIKGMQTIIDAIYTHQKYTGEVLLEISAWTKTLVDYLKRMTDGSYREMFKVYITPIIEALKSTKHPIKIIIDTAHIYNNGCTTYDDYIFTYNTLKLHLSDYIHLNGNVKPPFTSDEHIPFFTSTGNHMNTGFTQYTKMLSHVFSNFRVCICENSFGKYPVLEQYYKFASKNKLSIIPKPNEGNYVLA